MNFSRLTYILSIIVFTGIVISLSQSGLTERSEALTKNNEDFTPLSDKGDPFSTPENYYRYKKERKALGHAKMEAPEMYALFERERRIPNDLKAPEYAPNHRLFELERATKTRSRNFKNKDLDFIERGPANVAGRTRALLVLPGDPAESTWLAGSASGGIWKTENAGQSWVEKTQGLPNLGTNTLAISESDPNIIYAGTGEHFTAAIDGSGMFKSTDQGESWVQIVAPGDYDAFRNVSRIIVDPNDANVVVTTTSNSVFADSLRAAIYKSVDGGQTWDLKRLSTEERYDDLAYNPQNFNTIYTAVRRLGVLKSVDGGNSWQDASAGMNISGRVEIATSPLDTNYVWAGGEGGRSGTGSDIYRSVDGGASWELVLEADDEQIDYYGSQGWYDNVIEPHPFLKDIVYVGGIDLFRVSVSRSDIRDVVYDINDLGAFDFLDFINGTRIGGGILEGTVDAEDVVSIELRFGQGGQKAHRFSVGGAGSGVPAPSYLYQDLVDVPFQAWDITNNRQLMLSFRDQGDDGEWTLKTRSLSANTPSDSREYIFVHGITYADTAHVNIAQNGGHEFEQQYFFWPVLRDGQQFNPNSSEAKAFEIIATLNNAKAGTTRAITDAYNNFNGNNSFTSSEEASNTGHHPDQHGLHFVNVDPTTRRFRLLTTNDGGVYLSNLSSNPGSQDNNFTYSGRLYNTTQFYGADKMPGEDRYIGGMQDNGTWMTNSSVTSSSATTNYEFALGGDGFEVIWNNRDPNLILGSIQFNSFRRSIDGGISWDEPIIGLNDFGRGEAPFISRLANSRLLPDRVFAVGVTGVWISNDFGESWTSSPINSNFWSLRNSTDIEVSPANPDVVWAGGALLENNRLFVSTDGGTNFEATNFYDQIELGTTSGIGLHPEQDSTAYALFSFAKRSKVLKTTDLGQNWHDISGFDNDLGESTRGFPDVAIKSLLVFPNDTSRIWVGSEIGIIETLDGGNSWELLESNMPPVNVYDMKIQDDQIVIATFGRGIWSVQVDGISPKAFFPPNITYLSSTLDSMLGMQIVAINEFDSLHLFIGDTFIGSLNGPIAEGPATLIFENVNLDEGIYDFNAVGFKEGIEYKSLDFRSAFFKPLAPVRSYFNDFSVDSLKNDFIGEGFSVRLEPEFDDLAIHSPHNYLDRLDITYQLKRPIIVEEEQLFVYKDVVIVEPGQSGALFGSDEFFDYVIVEGTNDGVNWIPLEDGYDSSENPNWDFTYAVEGPGRGVLFEEHQIDLKEVFAADDTIFIRYRLSADNFVTAWGWAIDDVEVRDLKTTPVFDIAYESLKIFPNPVSDLLTIQLPDIGDNKGVVIYDVQGRKVYQDFNLRTNSRNQVDLSEFQGGIYFLEIYESQKLIASEKIVVIK